MTDQIADINVNACGFAGVIAVFPHKDVCEAPTFGFRSAI
jgi:hypothetical protein